MESLYKLLIESTETDKSWNLIDASRCMPTSHDLDVLGVNRCYPSMITYPQKGTHG